MSMLEGSPARHGHAALQHYAQLDRRRSDLSSAFYA
jgi:hypothetical protein